MCRHFCLEYKLENQFLSDIFRLYWKQFIPTAQLMKPTALCHGVHIVLCLTASHTTAQCAFAKNNHCFILFVRTTQSKSSGGLAELFRNSYAVHSHSFYLSFTTASAPLSLYNKSGDNTSESRQRRFCDKVTRESVEVWNQGRLLKDTASFTSTGSFINWLWGRMRWCTVRPYISGSDEPCRQLY